jgi:HK97 family phage major capsid protein
MENELVLEVKSAAQKLEAATTEIKAANERIKAIEAVENQVTELKNAFVKVDQVERNVNEMRETLKSTSQLLKKQDLQKKSVNDLILDGITENFSDIQKVSKGNKFSMELKAVADMTFSNNFPTADTTVADVRPGIIQLPSRRLHVRSLLTGGSMSKSTFDFMKESGGEGDLATVAEGAAKSQFDIDFTEASVPAQYIAGFLVMSKKMLDDVEGMRSFLNFRLVEKYLNAEDAQILSGNGTSPNLRGLLTAATSATSTATADIEQLMDAITQLETTEYYANGILLNPVDYNNIAKNKASGSGEYDLPSVVQMINGQLFVYGVPVYKSNAIAADTFLVGDWVNGAQLLTREAPRVEFFEQDSTNVRSNKITVRIEGRVALPIYHDGAFVKGDFGNIA